MDGGCLRHQHLGTSGASDSYPPHISLNRDQYYRLRFSAMADARGDMIVNLFREDIGGEWLDNIHRRFALFPSRQDHAWVFQWPFSDTLESRPHFTFDDGSPAITLWLDNVTLEPVDAILNDATDVSRLYRNTTSTTTSVSLGGEHFLDLDGQPVTGHLDLPPYSARILILDPDYPAADLLLLVKEWHGTRPSAADINKDGHVDDMDLFLLQNSWPQADPAE